MNYWLWHSAVFISAATAAYIGPKVFVGRVRLRRVVEIFGYLLLASGFLWAAYQRSFSFEQMVKSPDEFFSVIGGLMMVCGIVLLVATSFPRVDEDDNDDDDDDRPDLLGPDFDQARERWARQYRPTSRV